MSEFKVGKINKKIIHSDILNRDVTLSVYLPEDYTNLFKYLSSSVLEYKMTKCTSKWTTFFILTYIPNYIQNDL